MRGRKMVKQKKVVEKSTMSKSEKTPRKQKVIA